jgi:5,10-methenyltetrahydrofolate synthetase
MNTQRDWPQVKVWRKARRVELIARREQAAAVERQRWNGSITHFLESGFAALSRLTIGFCWPYKGEFDARFAIRTFRQRGAAAALPAVVDKTGPLEFRLWWPGAPMTPGVYSIPVPDGTQRVVPDAAIVPMNGFDEHGYRLGYGGGYFDRTLAAAIPRPVSIGVSYELARLPSIFPQPHDIAMDFVVTEAGIYAVTAAGLQAVDAADCNARLQRLCLDRGLPRTQAGQGAGYASPPCYAAEFPGYFGETGKD